MVQDYWKPVKLREASVIKDILSLFRSENAVKFAKWGTEDKA